MNTLLSSLIIASSLVVTAAYGASPHPVGKWCKADQESLCSGMEWGTGLGKCLHEKSSSVSDLCKKHHPKLFGSAPPTSNTSGQ